MSPPERVSGRRVRLRWAVSRGARRRPAFGAPGHSPARTPGARPARRSFHKGRPIGFVFGPVPALAYGHAASANGALAFCPGKGRARPSRSRCRPPWLELRAVPGLVGGSAPGGLPLADSRVRRVVPPATRRSSLRADLLPRSRSFAALRYARSAVGPALRSSLRVAGCALSRVRAYGLVGRAGVLPGVPHAPSLAPGQAL
jgi:hypothetical protein